MSDYLKRADKKLLIRFVTILRKNKPEYFRSKWSADSEQKEREEKERKQERRKKEKNKETKEKRSRFRKNSKLSTQTKK